MRSALAGDETGARWNGRDAHRGGGGGWTHAKADAAKSRSQRWRDDEREGPRQPGGGWNTAGNRDPPPGSFDHPRPPRRDGAPPGDPTAASVSGVGGKSREPARPNGRGFSLGRGRGAGGVPLGGAFGGPTPPAGQARPGFGFGAVSAPGAPVSSSAATHPHPGGGFGAGAGAPLGGPSSFLDGFNRRAQSRFGFGDGTAENAHAQNQQNQQNQNPTPTPMPPHDAHHQGAYDQPTRRGPARYRYGAAELFARARALAEAGRLAPPASLDPDSVPLVTVKPGDAMWELTVEGSRRGREWGASGPQTSAVAGGVPAPRAPPPRANAEAEDRATCDAPDRGGSSAKNTDGDVPEWASATAEEVNGARHAGFLGGGAIQRLTPAEAARLDPRAQPSWLTEGASRRTARAPTISWARWRANRKTPTGEEEEV